MKVDAELYRVFYEVASCGSITGAARVLHISQPAVSKAIIRLEEITGCTLFNRHSKGVWLTTEGEEIFTHVKTAFNFLGLADNAVNDINAVNSGCVRIGVSNTLCNYYFMPKLEAYHKIYPDVRIKVVNVPSPESVDKLDSGEIDFAVITYSKTQDTCSYQQLMEINDIFVSRQEYHNELRVEDLSKLPLMLLEKGNQTRSYIDSYLAANSVNADPEIEIGSMDFLVDFAEIGIGIACVIKEFVADKLENGELYQLPVSPGMKPRKMGVVTRNGMKLSKAAQAFIELILDENN